MPNRIIKESICYSEDIDKLTPFEETVFYRLMVRVDDFGRLDARKTYLKNTLFVTKRGVTEKSVSDALLKLSTIGIVQLYEVDKKPYLTLTGWDRHQTRRASTSKYPAPDEGVLMHPHADASTCKQVQADVHVFVSEFVNEDENDIRSSRGAPAGVLFDQFWDAYPKKVAKEAARKAFAKHKPDVELLGKMLATIEQYKRTDQWTKDGGQFIPNPATWLNQMRWEDQVPKNAPRGKTVGFQNYDQGERTDDFAGVDLLAEARELYDRAL